jgi:hypothetical protein
LYSGMFNLGFGAKTTSIKKMLGLVGNWRIDVFKIWWRIILQIRRMDFLPSFSQTQLLISHWFRV